MTLLSAYGVRTKSGSWYLVEEDRDGTWFITMIKKDRRARITALLGSGNPVQKIKNPSEFLGKQIWFKNGSEGRTNEVDNFIELR